MDDMDPPAVVPAAAEKQPSTARAALTLLAAVISTALLSLVFVLPALASNDAHIITMVIASVLVNLAGTALFILKVRGKKWVLQAIVIYDVLLCAIIIGSVWGIYLPVFARFQSGRISVSRVSALRNHPSASAVEFSAGAKISLGQVGSAESSYTVRNAEIVSCYVVAPIGDAANPSRADALAACAARGSCAEAGRATCVAALKAVSDIRPPLGGLVIGGGATLPRSLTSLEPRWEPEDVQPAVDALKSAHGGLGVSRRTPVLLIEDIDAHAASLTAALAASAATALAVCALVACWAYWWFFPFLADMCYEPMSSDPCLGIDTEDAD